MALLAHYAAIHSTTDISPPQSATLGLHPIARRLLLINQPRRYDTLSWRWYTAAVGENDCDDGSMVLLGSLVVAAAAAAARSLTC